MAAETAVKYTQTFEGELDDVRLTPYTAIPDRVRRFFAVNANAVLSLCSANPMMISQLQATGRRPVHYRELDEELLADLRRSGFTVNETDGTVRKADCALYVQGAEEREHWRQVRLHEQLMQSNADEVLEIVEETRREAERSGRSNLFRPATDRDVRAGRVPVRPPAGAHVYSDRDESPGKFD